LWLHSLKVAQLLRSAACLHTNQSRSYLNHLVYDNKIGSIKITEDERTHFCSNACNYSRFWSFKTYSSICWFYHWARSFLFSPVLISQVSSSMKSFVPIQSLFTVRQRLVLHLAVCSVNFAKICAVAIYLKRTELPVVYITSHHITSSFTYFCYNKFEDHRSKFVPTREPNAFTFLQIAQLPSVCNRQHWKHSRPIISIQSN